MKDRKQSSLQPAQLLLLLQHLQQMLLPQFFQLRGLPQLQIPQFLENIKVSKTFQVAYKAKIIAKIHQDRLQKYVNSRVLGNFGPKKITQNFGKFLMFLNYTSSSWILFCVKMSQYFHDKYCLQKVSTDFVLKLFTHFGLEVTRQFCTENYKQKISNIHQDFLNYIKCSWIMFYAKMSWNPHFT